MVTETAHLATRLAATGAPGGSPAVAEDLPPETRARLLLAILAVALIALIGLAVLTIIRRSLRRTATRAQRPHEQRRRQRSAWSEAGRRAAVEPPEEADPNAETPPDGLWGPGKGPAG